MPLSNRKSVREEAIENVNPRPAAASHIQNIGVGLRILL